MHACGNFGLDRLAVTQHRDDEQRVASNADRYDPGRPATSLDLMLANGDNLRGADVVLWANVGVMHMPVTEDVPLVSNFPTGFTLRPTNFFVENAAMDVRAKTTDYELCAPRKPE